MKNNDKKTNAGFRIASDSFLKSVIDVFWAPDYQWRNTGGNAGGTMGGAAEMPEKSFESLWTDSELQYIFSVIDEFNILGFNTLMLFQRNSRVGQIICRTFDPDLLTQWVLELFCDFPNIKLSVLKTLEELDGDRVYH